MTFSFDIVLLIIAVFMFLSGLYFGFFNELRRVLSNVLGLVAAIFLTDIAMGFIGGIANIIGKVVTFVFTKISIDIASKLAIGFVIFLVVKLIVFAFVGIFKRRGTKAFLKDKSGISCLIGGILGLVNALAVGVIFLILFECALGYVPGNIAPKIYGIIPQIKQIMDSIIPAV